MQEEKKEKIVEETVLENNEEKIPDIPDEKAKELEPPKIPTNDSNNEEKEVAEEENDWKQKLKSFKNEHGKEYLKSVLILLGINFALLLLYQLYNDVNYYTIVRKAHEVFVGWIAHILQPMFWQSPGHVIDIMNI